MLRLIRNSKAFTLVEILIVVAILGLLAAIAIPNLMKSREDAATTACRMNRAVIAKAIKIWATKRNETVAAMQTAFGTSAAKRPKIATTIKISTSVKALLFRINLNIFSTHPL